MYHNNNRQLFQMIALAIAPALAGKLDSPSAWLLCVGFLAIAAMHDCWLN